jgi:endonuclease-3
MTEAYGPFPEEPRLDPIHELTFTILSQHTSDRNSERAFRSLMQRFGSLEAVVEADVAEIEVAISGGGLAKVKAPRIKEVLGKIIELNGSLDLSFLREMPLPEAKAWLRQLPGIGPKSAGIILSFSLGMPAMAIDTHIYRVSQRLALIGPKVTADKAHDLLEAAVEPEQVYPFHQAFINHGRLVCKAQRPRCQECVVGHGCPSRDGFIKAAETEAKAAERAKSRKGKAPARPRKAAAQAPHAYPEV